MKYFYYIILNFIIINITLNNTYVKHINSNPQYLSESIKDYLNNIDKKQSRIKGDRSILGTLASALNLVANDPNKNKHTNIRISDHIAKEEQDFLKKRKIKVKSCLEKFLNIKIKDKELPNIALCGSGGGLRAMFSILGVLSGLESINLLDSITYFSALSGSTFALGSWLAHRNKAKEIQKYLISEFSKNFTSNFEMDEIIKAAIGRMLYGQKLSPVNLYGALLANRLFGDFKDKAYHLTLSESKQSIENGVFPFPIYTAISTTKVDNNYNWFELNPYEVKFKYNNKNISIPSWSLGRKFKECKTKSKAPEYSLGFLIGICSSAFTISAEELVQMYQQSIPKLLRESLMFITTETEVGKIRILPGIINNPIYKCSITKNTPYETLKTLYLIDAGINFNLPIPPLLKPERNIDIIIIMDSSANVAKNAPELKKAEDYAKIHNLKFPKIDYSNITNNNISVFGSENSNTPTIIYIPLIKNPSFSKFDPTNFQTNSHLKTFNLRYTEEQSKELCDLTFYNITSNKQLLKNVILSIIDKKSKNN